MEQKKHYLVYKTTCLLNGKIYIGQHQTYDQNDDYLGSGKELNEDIEKFGTENFKREILFDFDTQKEMDDKEKELVTEEFVARSNTYNMRVGGQNSDISDTYKFGRAAFLKLMQDKNYNDNFRSKMRDVIRRRWRETPEQFRNSCAGKFPMAFKGKHHTEEAKRKIGQANSIKLLGERNGSFGTVWIYNESLKKNIKVKKELVDGFLSEGWKLGRKMSFNGSIV